MKGCADADELHLAVAVDHAYPVAHGYMIKPGAVLAMHEPCISHAKAMHGRLACACHTPAMTDKESRQRTPARQWLTR